MKKIIALLTTVLALVGVFSLTAFAAESNIPASVLPEIAYEAVDSITSINRDLHASYKVTGEKDKKAILAALDAIELESTDVKAEDEGLRLLQIRMKDGSKLEYWVHENALMRGDVVIAAGEKAKALWETLAACEKNYRANIEWIGYMNPYRVTDMTVKSAKGSVGSYRSAVNESQRKAILDVCQKFQQVQVGTVQTLQGKNPATYGGDALLYSVSLVFEDGKEQYVIYVFENDRITVSVASIDYDLTYTTNNKELRKALLDTLAIYC